MAANIKFKKGLKSALPTLALGEPALTTDEERLYVGGNSGNIGVAMQSEFNVHLAETVSVKSPPFPLVAAKGDGVTDDRAAIQVCMDYVAPLRGRVFFPEGTYLISDSLELDSFVTLEGANYGGVKIKTNNATPILVNKSASLIYSNIEKIILYGGTYGLDINITDEVANLNFKDVGFNIQTNGGIRCNKLFQTSYFESVSFYHCVTGITISDWTTNHCTFVNTEFIGIAGHAISLKSAEVVNFFGCRFEGGGIPGNGSIILSDSRNISFNGCYFERIHNNLLFESQSDNSIIFENCHFTGASDGNGGLFPFSFTSDGIVSFGSNTWYQPSDGSEKMFIKGINDNFGNNNALYFDYSKQKRKFVSKRYEYPPSGSIDLVKFNRPITDGSLTNGQILTGKLTIQYFHLINGGFSVEYSREYHVKLVAVGISNIDVKIQQISAVDSPRDTTLTIQVKTGVSPNDLILEGVFTGVVESDLYFSEIQWAFESISTSTVNDNYIVADLA